MKQAERNSLVKAKAPKEHNLPIGIRASRLDRSNKRTREKSSGLKDRDTGTTGKKTCGGGEKTGIVLMDEESDPDAVSP